MGAQGGPLFKTTILVAASGDEQRIVEWDIARGEWDIGYGINSTTALAASHSLFPCCPRQGSCFSVSGLVRLSATDAVFGTGDGSTTDFQLAIPYHSYQDDGTTVVRTYTRNIFVPASSPLTIKDNGSTVNPTDYDLQIWWHYKF